MLPPFAFAIVPLRMVLVMLAGLSIVVPLVWLLEVAVSEGQVDGAAILVAVLVIGVGQAVLGYFTLVSLLQPAPYCEDMRAMLLGDGWVRWQYDEKQWRDATRIEAQRARRALRKPAQVVLAVAVLFTLVGLAASGGNGWSVLVGLGVAVIWGYVCLVTLATNADTWARKQKTGEIHISRLGIYRRPGGYTPLTNLGYQLDNVTLVNTRPAALRFEVVNESLFVRRTVLAEVAVPVGHEEEASQLVDRFRAQRAAR